MKDVAPGARSREKLEQLGAAASLDENEPVVFIFANGSSGANAPELVSRLITCAGGVHGLMSIGFDRLRDVPEEEWSRPHKSLLR